MSKKLSFTLAEVLISVLVIGIIAVVCAPMIRHIVPNKNAAMVKKAYYVVDNIVKDLMNDTYYYPDMRSNCAELEVADGITTTTYLTRAEALSKTPPIENCFDGLDYTAGVNIAGTSEIAEGEWKFARLFLSKLKTQNPLQDSLNRLTSTTSPSSTSPATIATTDGMVYNFDSMNFDDDNDSFILRIDVNGKEGPNSYSNGYSINEYGSGYSQCSSYDIWEPDSMGGNFSDNNFDRIAIRIFYDGRIDIPFNQTGFVKLINNQNDY